MGLPVLVVYGAWIWKLALVVITLGTIALVRGWRRRKVRAYVRRHLENLATNVTAPRPGSVTLRGKVTRGGALTAHQAHADLDRSEGITLSCDGTEVEVVPAIRVVYGSTARGHRDKPATIEIADAPTVVNEIRIGDDVLATGQLESMPPEHASYREGTPRYVLRAARLTAQRPAIRPLPMTRSVLGAFAGATALGVILVMYVAGVGLEADSQDRIDRSDGIVPAFGRHELAAALPGSRQHALEEIGREVAPLDHATSKRAFEARVQLAELRGDCPVRIYTRVADYEGGLAAAERCGTARDRAKLLYLLGRFAEAQKVAPDDLNQELAIRIAVANGNWTRAAEISASYDHLATNGEAHRCFGALMHRYAGEADAFAKIEAPADSVCKFMEAASRPVDEQAAAFAAIRMPRDDHGSARLHLGASSLELASGPYTENLIDETSVGGISLMFDDEQSWVYLAPFQLAAHPADRWTETAQGNMVAFEALRGNLVAAHAHLAQVTGWQHDDLALGLALREGAPLPSLRAVGPYEQALAFYRGEVPNPKTLSGEPIDPEMLKRMVAGDGEAFASVFARSLTYFDSNLANAMALVPRLTSHLDRAREALRYFRNDSLPERELRPLADATAYRDLARLAGDTSAQASWQAVVDRWFAMIADRQKLYALLFWD